MIIATCAKMDNHIQFFKADDGQTIQKFEVAARGVTVTDLQFSSNSRLIVFCCDDASFGVLNTMQHKVEQTFQDQDKNLSCVSVTISTNDNLVASASSDGQLIVRSLKDKQIIIKDKSIKSALMQVRFSPTSNKTLVCAY